MYKDDILEMVAPDKPSAKGHIKLVCKLVESKDFAHALITSSLCSMALFEKLGAHGTNIILSGNTIDILTRFEDDGLNLLWKPLQLEPPELDAIAGKIKDCVDSPAPDVKAPQATAAPTIKQESAKPASTDKLSKGTSTDKLSKSYLLKQLERLP